ncbi:hypothetical protein [Ensifer sp. M14]|nr:hypothetical protein [Ensifer sp. M14]
MSIATVIFLFINGRGTIRGLDGACLPGERLRLALDPATALRNFHPLAETTHSDDVEWGPRITAIPRET